MITTYLFAVCQYHTSHTHFYWTPFFLRAAMHCSQRRH